MAKVNITYLFIIVIATAAARAQLADILFPGLAKNARSFTNLLADQPLVQVASQASGNVFSTLIQGLTAIPLATARSFHPTINFPSLLSDSNIVDYSQNIVTDFNVGSNNEDVRLNVAELILKYGYPMERHRAVTEDGYILQMFRIPSNGSAVFLMHGLLGSADDYVIAGPESSLAYILAREGYDVWLGNARGNKHSRNHMEFKASDAIFWDFSWHEIGCYDLPAMIDYVLNITEQKSLKYIGHSQGTTSFFVMASERPEYNEKISLMVALSPVAFMSHANSPFVRLLSPTSNLLYGLLKSIGVYEFLPDSSLTRTMKQLMCGRGPLAEILCSNVLFLMVGFGFDQLNVTNLPVIYSHVPSGASSKQFVHYGQGVISREFRQFDYGHSENVRRYGSSQPPKYNLKNIVAPISLFYSDADWLSHPTDVDELYSHLDSAIDIYKIPLERFNHLDFIWAKDFENIIYSRLRKLLMHF
ncbi:lipase 3-like [Ostrinia nubilalis]|uniref:lipase 3-like n=1 Tax=Ostrinia nubilalis TaxID=29057 RepID=UPI0030823023